MKLTNQEVRNIKKAIENSLHGHHIDHSEKKRITHACLMDTIKASSKVSKEGIYEICGRILKEIINYYMETGFVSSVFKSPYMLEDIFPRCYYNDGETNLLNKVFVGGKLMKKQSQRY